MVFNIREWLNLSAEKLFWLFLFCSLVFGLPLFIPDDILKDLGLVAFLATSQAVIGGLFLFSFAGLVTLCGKVLFQWTREKYRRRRALGLWQKSLHRVTPEERAVLRQYIERQSKTQNFEMADGVVRGLVAENILFRPSSISVRYTTFAHNIQPWAWDYLNEHPELVMEKDEPSEIPVRSC